MKYHYEGFDKRGVRKGHVEAEDEQTARDLIAGLGVTATTIRKSQDITMPWERRPPSLKDKALFTQQFAQLLGGGISMKDAVKIAGRSSTNKTLREAAQAVRKELENGEEPTEVFARKTYRSCFDEVFTAFIELGSASGNIARPMRELADMYKWQLKIVGMVKKGLTLPTIIMLACIIVTYFIMARVVPTFMGILDNLKADLPPLTKAVKNISEFLANPMTTITILGLIGGLTYALIMYRRTPTGRLNTDRALLRTPIVGNIVRTFILARVSRSVAVMLRNNIPIDQALVIAGNVATNEVYARHIATMRDQVINGFPMFPVLMQNPKAFPEQFALQFRSGEERSTLKDTLGYLADIYNDEVTSVVESLTATMEPVLMGVLGSVVGVIVVSVFLPMTTMMDALQQK